VPKKRLLIVDDDSDICFSVAHRLEGVSYATRTACSGRQALTDVGVQRPDIIILDIRMPGIDGIAVMSELTKDETTKNIPIIMLSGSAVDKRRAFAAWARVFIDKPFSAADLIAAVDAASGVLDSRNLIDSLGKHDSAACSPVPGRDRDDGAILAKRLPRHNV